LWNTNTEPDPEEGNVRLLQHTERLWSGLQQRTRTVKYRQDDAAVSQQAFPGTGTPLINRQTLAGKEDKFQ
jgi:hypothetical protein